MRKLVEFIVTLMFSSLFLYSIRQLKKDHMIREDVFLNEIHHLCVMNFAEALNNISLKPC